MEYFFYVSKAWCNFDKINQYFAKLYRNNSIAEVRFDDSQYDDVIQDFEFDKYVEHNQEFKVFGADGYFYIFTWDGIVKGEKYPSNYPKLVFKSQIKSSKSFFSDLEYKEKTLKKYQSNQFVKEASGIHGYDKYVYVNEAADFVIPFRFKKSKRKNQPLVVYFGGGGTVGHDNYKQLHEFLSYTQGKCFSKYDCNVLLPQAIRSGTFETESRENFTHNTSLLIKQLLKNYAIDSNRVYVYGTSLGGGCVWNILLDSPDLFACALEAMGCYFGYTSLADEKFKELADIPIWMAHSSDDTVVEIASDDYFYDKLKSFGADVQYTRWDKYGHKMSYKLYRQKPWIEWMLSKSK